MPDQPLTHKLAQKRPRSGPDPLLGFLQSAQGQPVSLSVADVDRIDSFRLRTLLSAQAHWASQGLGFSLIDASPEFLSGLQRLGIPEDHFDMKEVA